MAYISSKWRIYFGIGLSVWETTKICGKWRTSLWNGSNMWGNYLIIWQTSSKCTKWLRDLGNGQTIWEMA